MSTRWRIVEGDLRRPVLIDVGSELFDAVLCDPPYELGFMGKKWDASGVAFRVQTWQWVFDQLRPGAPLLAFGGTRTYHRMTCALEDAGFEIRDCFSWLYGSGFPKSFDISKGLDATAEDSGLDARGSSSVSFEGSSGRDESGLIPVTAPVTAAAAAWDDYGTALKPAWEPCVIARKPLDGSVVENVQRHGVGGLAIGAARIPYADDADRAAAAAAAAAQRLFRHDEGQVSFGTTGPGAEASLESFLAKQGGGRWPANVLLDEGSRPFLGEAARFFYTSKVSASERNDGLDDLPAVVVDQKYGYEGFQQTKAKNPHPTMKPVALTEYLARLILPPRGLGRPRRLLVPFSGVASEMVGALRAGWDEVVGVEFDSEYAKIARLRLGRMDTVWRSSPADAKRRR